MLSSWCFFLQVEWMSCKVAKSCPWLLGEAITEVRPESHSDPVCSQGRDDVGCSGGSSLPTQTSFSSIALQYLHL